MPSLISADVLAHCRPAVPLAVYYAISNHIELLPTLCPSCAQQAELQRLQQERAAQEPVRLADLPWRLLASWPPTFNCHKQADTART